MVSRSRSSRRKASRHIRSGHNTDRSRDTRYIHVDEWEHKVQMSGE